MEAVTREMNLCMYKFIDFNVLGYLLFMQS